jgi:periplasmic protein TonB
MADAIDTTPRHLSLAWGGASDLSPTQRWALGALVLAAHVVAAVHVLESPPAEPAPAEAPPLMVSMIAPEITPEPPRALATPTPPVPQAAPPKPTAPQPVVLSSKAPSANVLAAPPEVPKAVTRADATPLPMPAPAAPAAPVGAAPEAPPSPPVPPAPLPPKQITASAVRYVVPPQQVYPETSRRLGESGKVSLRVLVDEHGRAVEVQVTQSSGYSRLDQSAVAAMRAARFAPYLENGVPRSVWAPATITYDLQD